MLANCVVSSKWIVPNKCTIFVQNTVWSIHLMVQELIWWTVTVRTIEISVKLGSFNTTSNWWSENSFRCNSNFFAQLITTVKCTVSEAAHNSFASYGSWRLDNLAFAVPTYAVHLPILKNHLPGGSPGLVVMGDSSCLKGRGFESWCRTLDENDIFHIDLL